MSETENTTIETQVPTNVDTSVNTSVNTETKETTQTEPQPTGYDHVDFTPQQQARFDKLYGQVKAQDRKFNDALQVMREQSEVIEQLKNGVGNVVQHINTQDFANAEETAREEAHAAFQKGDSRAYLTAMEKVSELRASKIANKILSERQPQPQVTKPQDARQAAERAVQQGVMSPTDAGAFEMWQEERDNNGTPLRPWAKRNSENDPVFDSALLRSAGVFSDPKFVNLPINQKLAEVDRIMGVTRQEPTQNVMGANLTTRGKINNVKVSADMEKLLLRTAPRGSKANKADPIAWYREQVQKAKQQGARR